MTQHTLNDLSLDLRLMERTDREHILDFARTLSPHDLLFLRRDITSDRVADAWIEAIEKGRVSTLLAVAEAASPEGAKILGYATLDRSGEPWTQHVAEVRVLVGSEARGKGLGRFLTEQIFRRALEQNVEKLVARMTLDQEGAIAVFENLGFRPEGLLKDHVVDRAGSKHDLLVMAHAVADFDATRAGFGVQEAFAD